MRLKQTPCLKYSTLMCYTTRWALTREALLISHPIMTLWLDISPMCVDQVKNRYQCSNVALENTVKSMHLLIFSPFVSRGFNHRNFLICYSVFITIFHLVNCHDHFIWGAMFLVHWILTADTWCCLQFYPVCLVFILHSLFPGSPISHIYQRCLDMVGRVT